MNYDFAHSTRLGCVEFSVNQVPVGISIRIVESWRCRSISGRKWFQNCFPKLGSSKMRFIFALALTLSTLSSQAAVRYSYRDLSVKNPLYGWPNYPVAINNSGQIAFTLRVGDGVQGMLYSKGVVHPIGPLDGYRSSYVSALNDAGTVVGDSENSLADMLGFVYQDGSITSIGALGTGKYSSAKGINNAGQIVGSAQTSSGALHPFLRTDGVNLDLGLPAGAKYAEATVINDSGMIAGVASFTNESRGFIYQNGQIQDIGSPSGNYVEVTGSNNSGRVVGYSYFASSIVYPGHPFLYQDSHYVDLVTDVPYATANAINRSGQIVGATVYPAHACIFEGGYPVDLNSLVGNRGDAVLITATGINEAGQIVGVAQNSANETSVYLLTPLPPAPKIRVNAARKIVTVRKRVTIRGTVEGEITLVSCRISGKKVRHYFESKANWTFNLPVSKGKNRAAFVATGPGGVSESASVVIVGL